jgi:hypothetical protein
MGRFIHVVSWPLLFQDSLGLRFGLRSRSLSRPRKAVQRVWQCWWIRPWGAQRPCASASAALSVDENLPPHFEHIGMGAEQRCDALQFVVAPSRGQGGDAKSSGGELRSEEAMRLCRQSHSGSNSPYGRLGFRMSRRTTVVVYTCCPRRRVNSTSVPGGGSAPPLLETSTGVARQPEKS